MLQSADMSAERCSVGVDQLRAMGTLQSVCEVTTFIETIFHSAAIRIDDPTYQQDVTILLDWADSLPKDAQVTYVLDEDGKVGPAIAKVKEITPDKPTLL